MKKRFVPIALGAIFSLGILGIGLTTMVYGYALNNPQNMNNGKYVRSLPAPHQVLPSLQGKPVAPNSDPGIDSPYNSKFNDTGIVSAIQPPKNLDQGITLQYPSFLKLNVHPAVAGKSSIVAH